MKTKTTKLITIALGVATMTLTAGVVFSVGKENNGVLKSSAENTPVSGSITFNRSSTSGTNFNKDNRIFSATTSDGNVVYMKSSNNYGSLEKTRIAAFKGTSGDLQFYKNAEATIPYSFQNITSVTITTYSTNDSAAVYRLMFQSNDGVTYQSGTYSGWKENTIGKSAEQTYDFTAHRARYLKLICNADKWLDITSITIRYSCSYDYSNNAYYSNSAYYVVLDFDNNKYYRWNGGTLYWASFTVTYTNNGSKFTLEQTGTNATNISNFGSYTRPFNSLSAGATNTSGVIQNDGSIKFSTFTSSGTQEYTYVKII